MDPTPAATLAQMVALMVVASAVVAWLIHEDNDWPE